MRLPQGADHSLTENAPSPFQAEPTHYEAPNKSRREAGSGQVPAGVTNCAEGEGSDGGSNLKFEIGDLRGKARWARGEWRAKGLCRPSGAQKTFDKNERVGAYPGLPPSPNAFGGYGAAGTPWARLCRPLPAGRQATGLQTKQGKMLPGSRRGRDRFRLALQNARRAGAGGKRQKRKVDPSLLGGQAPAFASRLRQGFGAAGPPSPRLRRGRPAFARASARQEPAAGRRDDKFSDRGKAPPFVRRGGQRMGHPPAACHALILVSGR
jgi:hypothetical protein